MLAHHRRSASTRMYGTLAQLSMSLHGRGAETNVVQTYAVSHTLPIFQEDSPVNHSINKISIRYPIGSFTDMIQIFQSLHQPLLILRPCESRFEVMFLLISFLPSANNSKADEPA